MTRQQLRNLVRSVLLEGHNIDAERTYRCFGGSVVPFGSPECVSDIRMRMEDAIDTRDSCDTRTDKRATYNGLLHMLRRELRDAERTNSILFAIAEEEEQE